MRLAQKSGSFKSRRMEAFKELCSLTISSKDMKEFKLTKKTREIALDNFAKAIEQYDEDRKSLPIELDKILVNIRPTNLPEYTSNIWNVINVENILFIYGKLKPSRRKEQWLSFRAGDIHDELVYYFPSVSTLPLFIDPRVDEEEEEFEEED